MTELGGADVKPRESTHAYVIPILANRLRYILAGHVYLEEARPVRSPHAP